ncbi:MAG: hypothetical protein M0R74_12940 [Dehalococcoidia bacterium]|jgi:hypothetical protein|nr:hypothetical protein [Dehalococcoidia bacterium]
MNLDIYDILILLGLLAVVAGVWLIYPPAGLIAAGIALGAWAVLKDITRAEPEEPEEE